MSDDLETKPPGTVVRFDLYSHHFQVTGFGAQVREALFSYCRLIAQYGMVKKGNRFVRGMTKVFVGVTRERNRFHFHINEMEAVIRHLSRRGIYRKQIWMVEHPLYAVSKVDLTYVDTRTPRDVQPAMINYIIEPGKSKLIKLDPGRGKTFIALSAINAIRCRTFFCIKPMYIQKWIGDIQKAFKTGPRDIMVVQGTQSLKQMLELAKIGELEAKFILCSNMTYLQYLKRFEVYQEEILEMGFACYPWEVLELMGVGIRVIDEVHQDFHLNFRQDLYQHVPKTLSMTGTLEHDDAFINERSEVMFPSPERLHDDSRVVHVIAEAFHYQIQDVDNRIKYTNNALSSYSHVRFEQSIMRRKRLCSAYLQMIGDIFVDRFMSSRKPDQKAIVYFSTKEMCTRATEFYTTMFPELNVERYNAGEDEYSEMLEGDLIVTTLKSLGTAIDVPGLLMVILSDALSTRQGNLQVMGRLRPLTEPGDQQPLFLWLVCSSIEKHHNYSEKKVSLFAGRVVSQRRTHSDYVL